MNTVAAFFALLLLARPAAARNVDTGDVVPFVDAGGLIRLAYANDYFSGTDRYYTQGIAADVFDPVLSRSPLMRLLPALPDARRSYGLSLRDSAFTASNLDHYGPMLGDRPFAAYAFLGHVLVSKDAARGLTLVAELDTGMIGQAVGGRAQYWAHHVIGDQDPLGWDSQIRNDVLLDDYVRVEKTVQSSRWEDAAVGADATAGTVYDNAGAEATLRLGALAPDSKNRAYVFARTEQKLVGYDATLEGGLTNRHSPYTLSAARVDRRVPRDDLGLAVERDRAVLQAVWSDLGPEFTGGLSQRWVEISAMIRF